MNQSFFSMVNENFFNPLTNRNKQLNYDLLSLINNKMHDEMKQYSREEVIGWILDYFDNCPLEIIDDEIGVGDDICDLKTKAANKLRYFVNCGWLVDENDSKTLRTTYQIDSSAIIILNAMDEVVKSDSKPLEYTGYVYNIYHSLYEFDFKHSTDIVEQMYKNTKELVDRLRGLNVSIKKFLKKLITDDNLTPQQIFNQFLVEYQDKIILKNFKNLRERDNPAKYKGYIIEKIDQLFESNNYSRMIDEYLIKKKNGEKSEQNIEEADNFFRNDLRYIQTQFENIEDNLDVLDKKNAKYASSAMARIKFLLNDDKNIEGKIIDLLKNIAESSDYIEEATPFHIYDLGKLDENSLYKPRHISRKAESTIEIINNVEIDQKLIDEKKKQIFREAQFNCSNVNKFIMSNLVDNKSIEAKNIMIKNNDDFIKLFLACLYSGNKLVKYKIKFIDDKCNNSFLYGNKQMNNFIIERK